MGASGDMKHFFYIRSKFYIEFNLDFLKEYNIYMKLKQKAFPSKYDYVVSK